MEFSAHRAARLLAAMAVVSGLAFAGVYLGVITEPLVLPRGSPIKIVLIADPPQADSLDSNASTGAGDEVGPKWARVLTLAVGEDVFMPQREPSTKDEALVMQSPDEVPDIPEGIRAVLRARGCRVPRLQSVASQTSVLWGEFDHRGQRDLIVTCAAHAGAATYVFWGGDPGRREQLPFIGVYDSLSIPTPADIQRHAQPGALVTPDMPHDLDHDAVEVGCCECCSEYYYRHQGVWYSAPGAD